MKTICALIFLTAVSTPSVAADAPPNRVDLTIEERLIQVDVSIAIKQYEKVQQMLADARLEKALRGLHAEPTTDEESRNTEKRILTLESVARELRKSALHCDAGIRKGREVTPAESPK